MKPEVKISSESVQDSLVHIDHKVMDSSIPDEDLNPRSLYLRYVVQSNVLPLPLLVREPTTPYSLVFRHRGLGDAQIMPLIEVVEKLPELYILDLTDNRLTDASLAPLARKLAMMPELTY